MVFESMTKSREEVAEKKLQERAWAAIQEGDASNLAECFLCGIPPNLCNRDGQSLLHFACEKGHVSIVEYLLSKEEVDLHCLEKKKGDCPLHVAVHACASDCAAALLSAGANVNLKNAEEESPFHIAMKTRQVDLCHLFIKAGADLSLPSSNQRTPLYLASWHQLDPIVDILLQSGVEVNACSKSGWTPLHWAARKGNVRMGEKLLEANARVTAKNQRGLTPMHMAALSGSVEFLRLLHRMKGDVNTLGLLGETPLALATNEGNNKAILEILTLGGDPSLANTDGYQPLHWVRDQEAARILLSFGANANSKTIHGQTPEQLAKERGLKSLAKFLSFSESYAVSMNPDLIQCLARLPSEDSSSRRAVPDGTTPLSITYPSSSSSSSLSSSMLSQAINAPPSPKGKSRSKNKPQDITELEIAQQVQQVQQEGSSSSSSLSREGPSVFSTIAMSINGFIEVRNRSKNRKKNGIGIDPPITIDDFLVVPRPDDGTISVVLTPKMKKTKEEEKEEESGEEEGEGERGGEKEKKKKKEDRSGTCPELEDYLQKREEDKEEEVVISKFSVAKSSPSLPHHYHATTFATDNGTHITFYPLCEEGEKEKEKREEEETEEEEKEEKNEEKSKMEEKEEEDE